MGGAAEAHTERGARELTVHAAEHGGDAAVGVEQRVEPFQVFR